MAEHLPNLNEPSGNSGQLPASAAVEVLRHKLANDEDGWRALCTVLTALASAPPSAPVGVEGLAARIGVHYSQNESCKIGVPFYAFTAKELTKFAAALAQQPAADAYNRRLKAQLEQEWSELRALKRSHQQPAAPEGCGACGDGCANRSGGCRLAEENPPAAPSGEAWPHYAGSVLTSGADNEASVSFAFSSRDEAERFHEAAIAMLEAAPQQPAGVDGAVGVLLEKSAALERVLPVSRYYAHADVVQQFRTALRAAQQQGGRTDG